MKRLYADYQLCTSHTVEVSCDTCAHSLFKKGHFYHCSLNKTPEECANENYCYWHLLLKRPLYKNQSIRLICFHEEAAE